MNGDERLMRMAEELVAGRGALADALLHLSAYADMLDTSSPVEAYIFGRTMGSIESMMRSYRDLDPSKEADE